MKHALPAVVISSLLLAGSARAQTPREKWVGSWAAAPVALATLAPSFPLGDSTYRNIVHLSLGGTSLRVVLTNEFGATALEVGEADIAMSAGGVDAAIHSDTNHTLTFNGSKSVSIPEGGLVLSDPVQMAAPAFANLAVSVYLPSQTVGTPTCHPKAWSTNFLARGDSANAAKLQGAQSIPSWCFVKDVEVNATGRDRGIIAFGDSITDGGHSTPDANHRWPDFLAQRLLADKKTSHVSVMNEGIGGNRILGGGPSNPNAISRFDRDVLARPRAKYLIILEGINDIGRIAHRPDRGNEVTAPTLILGLTQMVERAHQHGLTVIGATLTPYEGAGYFSAAGEQVREAVNAWIRDSGQFDHVVDFDAAVRDPNHPTRYLPAYDHGDHLHPSDAGYKAMAATIDLKWFR